MVIRGPVKLNWKAITRAGIAIYMAMSAIYLFWGQINDDEGWYLYAGRLVYEGRLPYRDFAYTQMPLLPYLYGLPQLFLPRSVLLGRATSVAFSLGTLALCLSLARRYAGERGAALTAWLLASCTYGIYFSSIVKTYAFLSLAFALTFWVLASGWPDLFRCPLAIIASLAAALARLSAAAFLAPVALYCLLSSRSRRTRMVVAGILVLLVIPFALLWGQQPEAAQWNLLTFHSLPWAGESIATKMARILGQRVPDALQFYDTYLFLLLPALLLVLADRGTRIRARAYLSSNPPLWVIACGLGLFMVSHLLAGGWHIEYLSPAVVATAPLIAVVVLKLYDQLKGRTARLVLWGVLLAALIVPPARHGVLHIGLPGRYLSHREMGELSALLAEHTAPSEPVLAIQAVWAVVGADRSLLPGLSMAQFSYHDLDREQAQRLRLVNGPIVAEYVQSCAAPVVVLTDLDWRLLSRSGVDREVRQALLERYQLLAAKTTSNWPGTVSVYECRPAKREK